MTGKTIHITMDDGYKLPVYHAVPEDQRRGGLILVQEIFGVTEHIRELCDEYAAEGYEVLSPGLFDRESPGFAAGYTGADWEEAVRIARDVHAFDQSLADTQRCIGWLKEKSPEETANPVFIVGYCYGGSIAWRLAQTDDRLAAASSYYGGYVATRFAEPAPLCATLAHFGRLDSMVEIGPVEKLAEIGHETAQILIYEAGHGFNSDRRKDYHPESAELALERTLALFRACGG